MRVFNAGDSRVEKPRNLSLPVLPSNVHPKPRELHDQGGSAVLSSDLPLLVLPSPGMCIRRPDLRKQNTFSFEFGMPSIDRETWQRWVFRSFDKAADRLPYATNEGAFLKNYYDAAQGQLKPKLQIDDPALLRGGKGYYMARLERVDGSTVTQVKSDVWLSAEPISFPATGLASYQRPTVRATCGSDTVEDFYSVNETEAGRQGLQSLQMKGVEGIIYRLSIFNCIAQTDYEGAFETFTLPNLTNPATVFPAEGPVKINGAGDSVYLVSAFRILIEVAQEKIFTVAHPDQALYAALRCNFDPKSCGITVDLDPQLVDLSQVYRMETWRQVWRWQGRPAAPHPLLDPAGSITSIPEWESVEFGEIEENDHILFPMTPTGTPTAKNFVYTEQLGGAGSEGDRRGLHFRFGATAYSRYEGWLASEKRSVQATSAEPSL